MLMFCLQILATVIVSNVLNFCFFTIFDLKFQYASLSITFFQFYLRKCLRPEHFLYTFKITFFIDYTRRA